MSQDLKELVDLYKEKIFEFEVFLAGIETFFKKHPALNAPPLPTIHSIKTRMKDPEHLAEKINRKRQDGKEITLENLFLEITDLIGIRVLHLHQEQFSYIHKAINEKVGTGDWVYYEDPTAYTWDPESTQFYQDLGIKTKVRETYYTSIHYVIKPNQNNPICCEIQVRTLFEEIWGEIDHNINYPKPTESVACKEQLRVLSKLVNTGTRLSDSIFASFSDYKLSISKDQPPSQ